MHRDNRSRSKFSWIRRECTVGFRIRYYKFWFFKKFSKLLSRCIKTLFIIVIYPKSSYLYSKIDIKHEKSDLQFSICCILWSDFWLFNPKLPVTTKPYPLKLYTMLIINIKRVFWALVAHCTYPNTAQNQLPKLTTIEKFNWVFINIISWLVYNIPKHNWFISETITVLK